MKKIVLIATFVVLLAWPLTGCNNDKNQSSQNKQVENTEKKTDQAKNKATKSKQKPAGTDDLKEQNPPAQEQKPVEPTPTQPIKEADKTPTQNPPSNGGNNSMQVVAQPESIPVLINKQNMLPDGYIPNDLIYTTIPFVFQEKNEKRKMRSEAAAAIAKLFEGAKQQGISLLGVSAYRSHSTQVTLFNYYVKKDGYEKARTYSALPGTSEHETGLAIDVTGGNGRCPAQDCFANTPEANWLQKNVAAYGFIIRYPNGKAQITGYKYEPWHLRFVGPAIATDIMNRGITLEEYYNAIPVNQ